MRNGSDAERAKWPFLAGVLAVGLLAAACSSGHRDVSGPGTPDPCKLVTRKEVAAVLNAELGRTSPVGGFFASPAMPGQRTCTFYARSDNLNAVDLVVFPDPDGSNLQQRKVRAQADPKVADLLSYPRGLGRDAFQMGTLVYAHQGRYDIGAFMPDSDEASEARTERKRLLAFATTACHHLPSGSHGLVSALPSPAPSAQRHTADLRTYLVPPPQGSREWDDPPSADGTLSIDQWVKEFDEPEDDRKFLTDHGFVRAAVRTWTQTGDPAFVRVNLLRFRTARDAGDVSLYYLDGARRTESRVLDDGVFEDELSHGEAHPWHQELIEVRGDVLVWIETWSAEEPPDTRQITGLRDSQRTRLG